MDDDTEIYSDKNSIKKPLQHNTNNDLYHSNDYLKETIKVNNHADEMILSPHKLIGESILDYRITDVLGKGGMGIVFKAVQKSLDRFVAIKLLFPRRYKESSINNLKEEAKMIANLQHPNIVSVHILGEDKGYVFLVMDFCEGKTLEMLINEKKNIAISHRKTDINEIVKIIHQIALALSYAHKKKIIHRDIKPANIMIDSQKLCKVMDFGLARFYSLEGGFEGKFIKGTPAYMSPEQTGGRNIDPRSDIFSLGVVFYELIVGEKPFKGNDASSLFNAINTKIPEPPSSFNSNINPQVDAVLYMMMEKFKEDRYKDMESCIKDLELLMENKNTSAYKVVSSYHKTMKKRKGNYKVYDLRLKTNRKSSIFKIIVFLLLLFGVGVVFKSKMIIKISDLISKQNVFNFKKIKKTIFFKKETYHKNKKMELAKNYILIKRYDLARPIILKIIKENNNEEDVKVAKAMLIKLS